MIEISLQFKIKVNQSSYKYTRRKEDVDDSPLSIFNILVVLSERIKICSNLGHYQHCLFRHFNSQLSVSGIFNLLYDHRSRLLFSNAFQRFSIEWSASYIAALICLIKVISCSNSKTIGTKVSPVLCRCLPVVCTTQFSIYSSPTTFFFICIIRNYYRCSSGKHRQIFLYYHNLSSSLSSSRKTVLW